LAATAVIAVLGSVRFAYESNDAHVMIATAVALIGTLAAGLVVARFLRSHRLQDLALTLALIVLSASNLFLSAVPSAFGELDSHFVAWAPFCARLVGAFLFAFSVAVPDREVPNPHRAAWLALFGGLGLTALIAGVVAIWSPDWGDPMSDAIAPASSDSPHLTGDTLQLVLLGLTMALYLLAAAGFVRRAEETGDELMGWFALASPFGAAAALNYFLFPSLYPGWVYTADIFRLGFYLMLAVGAAREIAAWQEQLAEAAATGERRRIARDLHDVIAHSVTVMVVQASAAEDIVERNEAGVLEPIRAVQETGRAALVEISNLLGLLRADGAELGLTPQPRTAELADLVAQARAAGLEVDLRIEGRPRALPLGVDLSLYRIAQEALTNARKHSSGARAEVVLRYGECEVELVVDNEAGFESNGHRGGHGLIGMHERVAVFGGSLDAGPRAGGGFRVVARLPLEPRP
jgi:signal transduction histidine kinase